jgi:hypothetical protein
VTTTIADLAKLVRSKNAGPFWLTFDVMFETRDGYERVRDAAVLTRDRIAKIYGISENAIIVVNHEAAMAIKISFPRPQSSGSAYDPDVFGGQQYAPLLELQV